MAVKGKSSKSKKEEEKKPFVPDETMLIVAGELFKNLSPLLMDIKEAVNRKTIIINESDITTFISNSLKIAQINEIKSLKFSLLDNDMIEINMDVEKYNSRSLLKKELKIRNGVINSKEAYLHFSATDDSNNRANDVIAKVLSLCIQKILQTILLPVFKKNFGEDFLKIENENIIIDLKEGILKFYYNKTINQVLMLNVPFWGHKHLFDIFEIESVMCEKGQLWVDFIFRLG